MVGKSEVILTIGALIIFSLILLSANQMIGMNSINEVNSEATSMAVNIAQGVIDEAQTKAFDATTVNNNIPKLIPEAFSTCGPSPTEAGNRGQFNDFDDYDGFKDDIDTKLTKKGSQSFHLTVEVSYVNPPDFDMKSGSKTNRTNYKKMVVTVSSNYLDNNDRKIELSYLQRFYKTNK